MKTLKYYLLGSMLFAGICHAQETNTKSDNKIPLGKNIASVIPFSLTNEGLTFGVSFERFLDKDARLSVFMPVSYNQFSSKYSYYDAYDEKKLLVFLGLKLYTTRSSSPVRHAIGLMFGSINSIRHITSSEYHGGITEDKDVHINYPLTGFMIHNSVNVSISKHFNYTWEVDLGIGGQSRERDENLETSAPLLLTQMTLGYRF